MSVLTVALERIMNWLRQHQPSYAASFLPGLKLDEIQELEKELGFKLPEEIYQLYQWRNGTEEDAMALVFPSMLFLPLSEAIGISQAWNESILSTYTKLITYSLPKLSRTFLRYFSKFDQLS